MEPARDEQAASQGPRWAKWLLARRLPSARLAPLLAALVFVPALFHGFLLDDHWHRMHRLSPERWGFATLEAPWLFTFFDGDPVRTNQLIGRGAAVWWTDPHLRMAFFRPLSAYTHVLDDWLWGDSAVLAHVHSIAWFVFLTWITVRIFQHLLSNASTVRLASLLFVLDFSHGMPVAWIAGRNAVVASAFGAAALYLHLRAVRDHASRHTYGAAVCLVLALAAGEQGVAFLGYLFAASIVLDRDKLGARLLRLAPMLAVAVAWAAVYVAGHFGAKGSGMYSDVASQPLAALSRALELAPILIGTGLGIPSPEVYPFLPRAVQIGIAVLAAAFVVLALVALRPMLRARREAQFFLLGFVLAVLPSTTVLPSARLLVPASIGITAIAALGVEHVATIASSWLTRAYAFWNGPARLVLSPIALLITMHQMWIFETMLRDLSDTLQDEASLPAQRLIVVNGPDALFTGYVLLLREVDGRPAPHDITVLGVSARDMDVHRIDEHTLRVRVDQGFYRGGTDLLTRSLSTPMYAGDVVDIGEGAAKIQVVDVDERGVPVEITVELPFSQEGTLYRWVQWEGDRLAPFELPAIGESTRIPAKRFPPDMPF